MTAGGLMNGFPPARDQLVTLDNWRTAPFSRWAFHNVRRIVPSASISRSGNGVPHAMDLQDIASTAFVGPTGATTTISAALPATSSDALVVMRRGRIIAEWYGEGMDAAMPHIIFSVSKSVCGTLGGILAGRGLLDPNERVTTYIPEMAGSVYGGDCTVRHLLDMSVGISFDEDYMDPDGDVIRYRYAMGWNTRPAGSAPIDLRSFLARQKSDGSKHGGQFHYVSPNTDTLGWVYERACGRSYSDLIGEYIWAPMGAEHEAYITVDSEGAMRAAGGMCVSPRDLARFGELIRRRGVATDGTQVVPGDWIDDINMQGDAAAWSRGGFAELFPGGSYRSKWYQIDRERHELLALGIHGQFIYINPDAELVAIRMASEDTPVDMNTAQAWRRGFDAIAARFT
jgi:CubicO group peptidase (beta-lactamase class C family)